MINSYFKSFLRWKNTTLLLYRPINNITHSCNNR